MRRIVMVSEKRGTRSALPDTPSAWLSKPVAE
jgi:hypothetical protein